MSLSSDIVNQMMVEGFRYIYNFFFTTLEQQQILEFSPRIAERRKIVALYFQKRTSSSKSRDNDTILLILKDQGNVNTL